jgi:hypothetical protein
MLVGESNLLRDAAKKLPRACSVGGCLNVAVQGGVCWNHGTKKPICSQEGCTNQAETGSACIMHGAKAEKCRHEGDGGVCSRHRAKVLIESAVKCKRPAMLMIGEEKFVAKELDIKSRTQFVFC